MIIARGQTVIEFLQRMSTNDLLGLDPGASRGTILTNAIGRIVDVLRIVHRGDSFLLATSPGKADEVRSWLSRYVFFNDDVALEKPSYDFHLWGLYGPAAEGALETLAGAMRDQGEVYDTWKDEDSLGGIRILGGPGLDRQARRLWGDAGPGSPAHAAYEALRIEHGLPAAGHELTDDVIPLEVNLWHLVSFRKGCYIGQEVIARMESRQQVSRRLYQASLDHFVDVPQGIAIEGQVAGQLTSVAVSPRLGTIGLAFLRASAMAASTSAILTPSGVAARLQPAHP